MSLTFGNQPYNKITSTYWWNWVQSLVCFGKWKQSADFWWVQVCCIRFGDWFGGKGRKYPKNWFRIPYQRLYRCSKHIRPINRRHPPYLATDILFRRFIGISLTPGPEHCQPDNRRDLLLTLPHPIIKRQHLHIPLLPIHHWSLHDNLTLKRKRKLRTNLLSKVLDSKLLVSELLVGDCGRGCNRMDSVFEYDRLLCEGYQGQETVWIVAGGD